MNYLFAFLLAICYCLGTHAQGTYKTYVVKDSMTSRPVRDCYVVFYHDAVEQRAVSDYRGRLRLGGNVRRISISHIGYYEKNIDLQKLTGDVIYLVPKHFELKETTVLAQAPSNKGNLYKFDAQQAASTISIIGEPDVVRHISSFPGVSFGMEGTLGLFVRGGDSGGNGLYFNNVPMYVTSHLMGLFSVFPPEMVDEATFYQGGLPSSKGNQSSSLLDVMPKTHYGTPWTGKFYVSPYISGIYNSVPLVKDKMSLQLSGRTTFLPYVFNWLSKDDNDVKIDVYDIAAKIDYKVSDKFKMDGMFFFTNDYFRFTQGNENSTIQNWKSLIGKLAWTYQMTERLNLDFTSYYTQVKSLQKSIYYADDNKVVDSRLGIGSSLREWSVNAQVNYALSNSLRLSGGLSMQKQKFRSENEKYVIEQSDVVEVEKIPNTMYAVFGEVAYVIPNLMDIRMGYRHTLQDVKGESNSDFDIHLLNHWYLSRDFGIELSYDRQNQFYHVLEGLPTGWSMSMMLPSSKRFPSELTNQFYAGLFMKGTVRNIALNFSIGGYYRKMNNLLAYINAINAFGFTTDTWEEEVDQGKGKSYGLEFSSAMKSERYNATLSYTLSKSDREYPLVNGGIVFPFKFDRRHILNFQGKYVFYKSGKAKATEHSIGCAITYASGNRITLPIGTYQGVKPPYWTNLQSGYLRPSEFYLHIYDRQQMSEKNSIKIKDYFRTDVAYSMTRKRKRHIQEFTFSVYNIFNRHNPYSLFYEDGRWKQLSIMPIMPSFRWSISW